MSSPHPERTIPLSAVRALALHTQALDKPAENSAPADGQAMHDLVARLGCVQIDTLQMVQRSHYLALWSRLGCYDPADFDRMMNSGQERLLFEGWQHAAAIVLLREYRFQLPLMRRLRENPGKYYRMWLAEAENQELLKTVMDRIRREGALRVADFEYKGPKRGSWWDWKPAKNALEYLYASGELMIAGRVNFKRLYDLTERVLPEWVETSEPTRHERNLYWIEQGVRALGICKPEHAAEYAYLKRGEAKSYVESLLEQGAFVPVNAFLADGQRHRLIVHRKNLDLLERAADGELSPTRTTFLSPFDNLFWARGRDKLFWGFNHVLEAYKPQTIRQWGYYCLPILHRDRLVGRFDPKLERKAGVLRLKALYLEPFVELEEDLLQGIAAALHDFLAFHQARDLIIERSEPALFSEELFRRI